MTWIVSRYEQLAGAGAPERVEQYRKTLRQVIIFIIVVLVIVTIIIITFYITTITYSNHHLCLDIKCQESSSTLSLQALHVWLDQFPEDFIEPPNFPCLSHFESFCRYVYNFQFISNLRLIELTIYKQVSNLQLIELTTCKWETINKVAQKGLAMGPELKAK